MTQDKEKHYEIKLPMRRRDDYKVTDVWAVKVKATGVEEARRVAIAEINDSRKGWELIPSAGFSVTRLPEET